MEQKRLELVFAGKICRRGDRKHASALAAAEAGVWANAWGKASCREDSLGSVWWARLWCILTTKGAPNLSQFRSTESKASDVAKQGSKRQKEPCGKIAKETGQEIAVRSWGPEQVMGQLNREASARKME